MSSAGREAACRALAACAARRQDMPILRPEGDLADPREQALARAIHHAGLRHWLTIEHLLNRYLKQPLASMEPALAGVLLAAGSQLLFLRGLPAFAIVDESVELARKLVRPGAAKLANAVLRRLSGLVVERADRQPWQPAVDCLPYAGGAMRLAEPMLPDPADLPRHLAVATGHPPLLIDRWLAEYGPQRTREIALHNLTEPPTLITPCPAIDAVSLPVKPHEVEHWAIWSAGHDALCDWLAEDPLRRVQDPTAAAAIDATAELPIRSALDLCAGMGTKTRQLAARHPHAGITATDAAPQRRQALRQLAGRLDQLTVVDSEDGVAAAHFDLVVIDVPCSNTGVLARRLEARHRFSTASLKSVIALQKQIMDSAVQRVAPQGHVVYATCSIEPEENQQQLKYLLERTGGEVVRTELTLPTGSEHDYRDGGFFALVRCGNVCL